MTDPQQKLEMVVLRLNVKAECWFFSYHLSKGQLDGLTSLKNYVKDLESDNSHLNLLDILRGLSKRGQLLNTWRNLKTLRLGS